MILRQILALVQFFYKLVERVARRRSARMQHIDFRPLIYLAVDEFQPGELSPAGVGNATGGINGTPRAGDRWHPGYDDWGS